MPSRTTRPRSFLVFGLALLGACTIYSEHYQRDGSTDSAATADERVQNDTSTPPIDTPEPDTFVPLDVVTQDLGADMPVAMDVRPADVPMGTDVPSTGDPCASSSDCASCTPRGGCGWCASDNHCYTGVSSGSSSTSCSGTNWVYLSSECSDTAARCSRYTSCDSCAAVTGCGWCGASSRCIAGTSTGPSSGSCSSAWSWTRGSCSPASPCVAHTDCASCTAAAGCGWCGNRGACFSGTSTGPTDSECTGIEWAWTSSSCP